MLFRAIVVVCGVSLLSCALLFGDDGPVRLSPGRPVSAEMDLGRERGHVFELRVPADAVVAIVKITRTPAVFDLWSVHEDSESEFDHDSSLSDQENELRFSRYSDPPLMPGRCFVHVEYTQPFPPRVRNRTFARLPYTIEVAYARARIDAALSPDQSRSFELTPDDGGFRTLVVDVPAEAEVLRIDLDGTPADLDLLARFGRQIEDAAAADHTAISTVSRETLIIDGDSDPPLRPGRWFINLVDLTHACRTKATVWCRFDRRPPAELLKLPELPAAGHGQGRAIAACVNLSTGIWAGTGTLVSSDGLILTNYHVVSEVLGSPRADDAAAEELDDVMVSFTLDPRDPPVELFRGRIVETDREEDLALVQITTGYYGQPLPEHYRFPAVELAATAPLELGDRIAVVGFPSIGGVTDRPTVTLTRGIIAGFTRSPGGHVQIKTDAVIAAGSSGGAAFDADWRLVGVPTMTVSEDLGGTGQLGIVLTNESIPAMWRQRMSTAALTTGRAPPAPEQTPRTTSR